jgi:hypothetical protein
MARQPKVAYHLTDAEKRDPPKTFAALAASFPEYQGD